MSRSALPTLRFVATLALLLGLAGTLPREAAAQARQEVDGVYRILVVAEFSADQVAQIVAQRAQQQGQQQQQQPPAQGPQQSVSTGTGFLAAGRRIVATNNHVVRTTQQIGTNPPITPQSVQYLVLFLHRGEPQIVVARPIATLPGKDLALLETEADLPGTAWPLADFDPRLDLEVEAIGFPAVADIPTIQSDLRKARTSASIANVMQQIPVSRLVPIRTQGRTQRVLETDNFRTSGSQQGVSAQAILHTASISPGNSGGPLFNRCGQVVGVNTFLTASSDVPAAAFFSINSRELVAFLRSQQLTPTAPRSFCFLPGSFTDYVPYMATFLALVLALSSLVIARRRPEIVQQSVQVVRRTVARAVSRAPGRGGSPSRDDAPRRDRAPEPVSPRQARQAGAGEERATVYAGDSASPPPAPASGARKALRPLRFLPLNGGPALTIGIDRLIGNRSVIVGRGQSGEAALAHESVSRSHARLRIDAAGQLVATDVGSGNGTWKGGQKVSTATYLNGDEIRFGSLRYRVELPSDDPPSQPSWHLSARNDRGDTFEVSLLPHRDEVTGRPMETEWTIGRDDNAADIPLRESSISSAHARLKFNRDGTLEITDLNSTNGTFVDGRAIKGESAQLVGNQTIRLGSIDIKVL